ncbi:MAG: membrane protein insertion efficiency factor YidD [Candidatus Poriferisodalaceae bacterium]|nr:MAG: membrane protein insertion efficiency factor YidD [Acidimicrobiales bacterium MED-G01]
MNFPKMLLTKLIRVYQTLTSRRIPVCRFDPTCSRYAIEAIEHHGALRGAIHAVRRICRCHPWGGWGYDPVPASTQRVEV